jgi:peroxiredoxin
MTRLFLLPLVLLAAVLATAPASRGEDAAAALRKRPQILKASEHGVGALVPDLSFTDLAGASGQLSDFKKSKALVIAYTNASCPLCKRYGPRLGRMAKTWAARGVTFLFVNPTPGEDLKVVAAARKAHGLAGRYVIDEGQRFSMALQATTTGEVFLLDPARTLIYRGAVDDQYGVGWALDAPTHPYLERALEALLAGREYYPAATSAPGCVLGISAAPPKPTKVTWHGRVERIVQNHCQSCHRPGENGPFSLLTYAEAKTNAAMIDFAVKEKLMPPWFATAASLPMRNDHSLTPREREDVQAWVAAGCPKGDPKEAARPRTWTQGWKIGKPDAVIEIPKPVRVPAEGTVRYQHQTLTTDFGEDKWVEAFEIRPTAPQVVHHVLVFARYPNDHPRRREQPNNHQGIDGYFVAMVPGQTAYRFPEGTARFLPKGSRLRFQLHYTTNGTAAVDQTRVGFIFTKGKPEQELRTAGLANIGITIPAGAANHKAGTTRRLPVASRVFGFTPHMHVRGKAFRYEALLPDGSPTLLLDVPRFDFNWQLNYQLAEPLDLPAGTRIVATAWFDNSSENPANPDPTKIVRWGNQTWQEMLIGYMDWHPIAK